MNIPEYESYHEKKKHFDAAFPYNTYLCSIPLDFMQVPLHWHNEAEFIYVKKGHGIISVDFIPYEVSAPDIALILPGQLHEISSSNGSPMEYENIIFHPRLLEGTGTDESFHRFLQPLFSMQLACPTIFRPQNAAVHCLPGDIKNGSLHTAVRACLDENDQICMTFPPGYPLAIKGNLFSLFFAVYAAGGGKMRPASPGKNMEKLKSVVKYVEINYAAPTSIDQMADLAGFSKSHFMKYFKQAMGVPFTAYLNSYRLTMAARLLLQSDDTVLLIASKVGFDNLSYFNRAFKKQFGMTPSAYRGQR